METLMKIATDMGLGLGSLFLMGYLFIDQLKRQDKKDEAYIATLTAIQNNVMKIQMDADKNWVLTQDISRTLKETTSMIGTLKCTWKKTNK